MKIFLASDHGGWELKNSIKQYLEEKGYQVEDCGAFEFNKLDDYPDIIASAAGKVSQASSSRGIVFGKSGAGEAIVANKIKGIRAVLGFSKENVTLAREHNNANVLSLGGAFVTEELGKELAQIFLDTPFTGEERHVRRLAKIAEIEDKSL